MSTGVNVLRYSALALGLFYGFTHQASLSSSAKTAAVNKEYAQRNELITKAKAEWTKRTMPSSAKNDAGKVITDPEDPHFDFEAFVRLAEAGEVSGS